MKTTPEPQQQIATANAIEARFKALVEQRNSAMDRVVMLAGELADAHDKLTAQARHIAQLQAEKCGGGPVTQGGGGPGEPDDPSGGP